MFWEETFARPEGRPWFCYSVLDILVIWTITFVLWIIIFLIRFSQGFTVLDSLIGIIALIINVLALVVLLKNISRTRIKEDIIGISL
jgi:multisubunit Na+/H+ antiporter MnhF subunit